MQLRSTARTNPVILVVDDTPANLTLLRNILEPQSYQVLVATSGEKALQLLGRITPDLILLDIMMPGIDGYETLKRIKQIPAVADIPVIFITAKSELQDIVKGFELGAVDYICKPFQQLETLARTKAHLKIQHLLRVERRQSEQIRAIINNISDSILVCDRQGNIESANPATEHLFGYDENQLRTMSIAELLCFDGAKEDFIDVLLNPDAEHPWWQHPRGRKQNGETLAIDVDIREMFTEQPSFVLVIQDFSRYRHKIDQLHQLSETDPLTNIRNRRHFELLLSQSWQHCKRYGQPLSLLFIDVDHFKPFNDHYGHQAGDNCLKRVAEALVNTLSRGVDSVCRYGGEEFVAILPDTATSGALKLAEAIRQSVEKLAIRHDDSEHRRVTISIGVATCYFEEATATAKSLLQRADEALYQAKSNGRNQVRTLDIPAPF